MTPADSVDCHTWLKKRAVIAPRNYYGVIDEDIWRLVGARRLCLIRLRLLHVIDYQHLYLSGLRHQLEPELFF